MKTTNNTFGVIFYLRKYKATNDGKAPIYARITVNGNRLDLSVKRTIEESNWNAGKGMARGSREEMVRLNNFLEKFAPVSWKVIRNCYYKRNSLPRNWSKTNLPGKTRLILRSAN